MIRYKLPQPVLTPCLACEQSGWEPSHRQACIACNGLGWVWATKPHTFPQVTWPNQLTPSQEWTQPTPSEYKEPQEPLKQAKEFVRRVCASANLTPEDRAKVFQAFGRWIGCPVTVTATPSNSPAPDTPEPPAPATHACVYDCSRYE